MQTLMRHGARTTLKFCENPGWSEIEKDCTLSQFELPTKSATCTQPQEAEATPSCTSTTPGRLFRMNYVVSAERWRKGHLTSSHMLRWVRMDGKVTPTACMDSFSVRLCVCHFFLFLIGHPTAIGYDMQENNGRELREAYVTSPIDGSAPNSFLPTSMTAR